MPAEFCGMIRDWTVINHIFVFVFHWTDNLARARSVKYLIQKPHRKLKANISKYLYT